MHRNPASPDFQPQPGEALEQSSDAELRVEALIQLAAPCLATARYGPPETKGAAIRGRLYDPLLCCERREQAAALKSLRQSEAVVNSLQCLDFGQPGEASSLTEQMVQVPQPTNRALSMKTHTHTHKKKRIYMVIQMALIVMWSIF